MGRYGLVYVNRWRYIYIYIYFRRNVVVDFGGRFERLVVEGRTSLWGVLRKKQCV